MLCGTEKKFIFKSSSNYSAPRQWPHQIYIMYLSIFCFELHAERWRVSESKEEIAANFCFLAAASNWFGCLIPLGLSWGGSVAWLRHLDSFSELRRQHGGHLNWKWISHRSCLFCGFGSRWQSVRADHQRGHWLPCLFVLRTRPLQYVTMLRHLWLLQRLVFDSGCLSKHPFSHFVFLLATCYSPNFSFSTRI